MTTEPAPPDAPRPDALESGRRPRSRRLVVVGIAAGVALAGGLAAFVALRPRPRPEGSPQLRAKWQGTLLQPVGAADAGDGERVAKFSGFALQIETEPPGAVVEVDGQVRGESPVFAGVDCTPGDQIVVRARLPGRPALERSTACRADALVGLTLRLRR